jgi:LPXTG-motif cell wall-anchored protein
MTGVSVWMLWLGVAVLLAVGLLVRYFSRREPTDGTP